MRVNEPVTNDEYVLPEGEVIITRTDVHGRITYANQAFVTASEFTLEECVGQPQNIVRHPDMPRAAFADLWRTIRRGQAWSGMVKNRRKSGGFYWVRANVTPMMEGGRTIGYMSVRVKPTAQEIAAADALYRAMREGRAGHIRLVEGEIRDTSWSGRIAAWLRPPLIGGTWLVLGSIMALFATIMILELAGAASPQSPAIWGACLLGMLVAGLNAVYVSRRVATPMRVAAETAVRIIGGEVNCEFPESSDQDTRRLVRLLNQMNSKLLGVLKDTRVGVDAVQAEVVEILSANEDLARRANAHAAGLEEMAASMEEMTASVQQNAESAKQANTLTQRASSITQRGQTVVHDLVQTMSGIDAASREIADIVTMVDSIAFQTNLLALNAAVEAARAGEQGRGFAVVAQEVRALALRSSTSAKEIRQLVDQSLQRVERGSHLAEEAGAAMQEVVMSVEHVTQFVNEIMASSREQSIGIEQINQAVADMDRMTQEDAAMAQRVIGVVAQLREQSTRVLAAISAFNANVQTTRPAQARLLDQRPLPDAQSACVPDATGELSRRCA
ncbi:MAG: methyl-accepting chemotaxis protein [Steroidobacteraceae bacterium]|jgi:aerotaxis receptor|nr:methyl-accepting chemotaxis protein [Steroidobacteraceae bacterium]